MRTADYEPGQICQVMERGYMLHDRLLRPAKVVVASALPKAAEAAEVTENAGE